MSQDRCRFQSERVWQSIVASVAQTWLPRSREAATFVTSPVFLEGHLSWMHEQRGVASCAKGETGEAVYEQRLERAGLVDSSALLADGRLYYVTRHGRTFVLAAKPGFEQLADNNLRDGSIFNGSPAVDCQRLLILSDKFLYCIGK